MSFATLRRRNDGGTQRADFHVLALIRAGTGEVSADFTSYVLRPGTVVWLPPGVVHRWTEIAHTSGQLVLFIPTAPFVPFGPFALLGTASAASASIASPASRPPPLPPSRPPRPGPARPCPPRPCPPQSCPLGPRAGRPSRRSGPSRRVGRPANTRGR
ncbi:cupin domain-containing protein [Paractinoplanes atraurantiacus]|uniref:cupin domain-containing protein n=1 Tax=Paractinoplanes atraurantiacus TaxID=1036182 RepID=UPI000BE2A422